MKKHTLTIGILMLLALTAGILWFVRGGDKESTARENTLKTVTVWEDAAVATRDAMQEKVESVGESTEVQNVEQSVTVAQDVSHNDTADLDTSDWKEYCNEEYGFCVKVPEGWEVIVEQYTIDGIDKPFHYLLLKKRSLPDVSVVIGAKKATNDSIVIHPFRTGIPAGHFAMYDAGNALRKAPSITLWGFYDSDKTLKEIWFCGDTTSPQEGNCQIRKGEFVVEAVATIVSTGVPMHSLLKELTAIVESIEAIER